jgi:hypothetical protein
MKYLAQFPLDDDSPVFVEIDDTDDASGPRRVGRGDDGIAQVEQRFTKVIARVRPAAEAVLQSFREMNTPDEIGLEFGVKFHAKAGAIFAAVSSEATFKVALTWKNPKTTT